MLFVLLSIRCLLLCSGALFFFLRTGSRLGFGLGKGSFCSQVTQLSTQTSEDRQQYGQEQRQVNGVLVLVWEVQHSDHVRSEERVCDVLDFEEHCLTRVT